MKRGPALYARVDPSRRPLWVHWVFVGGEGVCAYVVWVGKEVETRRGLASRHTYISAGRCGNDGGRRRRAIRDDDAMCEGV